MILKIFSVFDTKTLAFMQPFYSHTVASALRSVGEAAKDTSSMLGVHPNDFQLFSLGDWDDATGTITPCLPHNLGTIAENNEISADLSASLDNADSREAAE